MPFGVALGSVQDAGGTPGTSVAFNTGVEVPAGGRLIIGVSWFLAIYTASVSDNSGLGLSWTQDEVFGGVTDDDHMLAVFSAHATSAVPSGTTITVTYTGASYTRAAWGIYATGIKSASYEDDSATAQGSGTALDVGPVTVTADGDLLVMVAKWEGGGAPGVFTPDGSETEAYDFTNASETRWVMTYREVDVAGNYSMGGDFASVAGVPGEWLAIQLAYRNTPWPPSGTEDARQKLRVVQSNLRLA